MGLLSVVGRAVRAAGFAAWRLGASLENPNVRLDDPAAYDLLTEGRNTGAGVRVNRQTALTFSPWWRGINLLSDSVGKLPLSIYQHLPTGGKQLASSHDWYHPLRSKVGPYWTPAEFKRLMVAWTYTDGNAYAYIDRAAMELIPLDPHSVSPIIEFVNGERRLWYVVGFGWTGPDGSPVPLRRYNPDELIHFKGFSYDGLIGYSVVQYARESIGLGMGARQYATTVFRNSGRPSVVLQYPNKLPEKHKNAMLAQWERMYAGADNAHRTAILDMGVQIKDFGFSAEDTQLLETRRFQIGDVANYVGVPAHKLGDRSGMAYNGLEQENLAFLGDTLEPILTRMEEELEDKLLLETEKAAESHEIQFDRSKLVLMDSTARANYFRTALGGHGWIAPNEAREEEGRNPQPGMDTIPVPLNTGNTGGTPSPADKPSGATAATQTAVAAASAYRPAVEGVFAATVLRCARRVCHQARAAAEKGNKFPDWADAIRQTNAAAFHGELAPVERLAGEMTGRQLVNVAADWLLEGLAAGFAAIAEKETAKTLAGAVAAACERFESELPAEAVRRFLSTDPVTSEG